MSANNGLTTDPLFVAATRPPMRFGVTTAGMVLGGIAVIEMFLLTRNLLWLLAYLPIGSQTSHAAELDPQAVVDAKHLLTAYINYTHTGNIDVLTLYSDAAAIKVTVTTLDRATKITEFSGQAWKRLLRESWYSGHPAIEPVELRNVTLQGSEARLEVSAQRYAQKRCYWDSRYTMVLAKNANGAYQIINENLYINHNNQCQAPDTLTISQDIKINQLPPP